MKKRWKGARARCFWISGPHDLNCPIYLWRQGENGILEIETVLENLGHVTTIDIGWMAASSSFMPGLTVHLPWQVLSLAFLHSSPQTLLWRREGQPCPPTFDREETRGTKIHAGDKAGGLESRFSDSPGSLPLRVWVAKNHHGKSRVSQPQHTLEMPPFQTPPLEHDHSGESITPYNFVTWSALCFLSPACNLP